MKRLSHAFHQHKDKYTLHPQKPHPRFLCFLVCLLKRWFFDLVEDTEGSLLISDVTHYFSNIACSTRESALCSAVVREPAFLRNRSLVIVRNWSQAAEDFFGVEVMVTRNGHSIIVLVSGTTMIVLSTSFISSGDTTIHGRVFRISPPCVGSRSTQYMSQRLICFMVEPIRDGCLPRLQILIKRSCARIGLDDSSNMPPPLRSRC